MDLRLAGLAVPRGQSTPASPHYRVAWSPGNEPHRRVLVVTVPDPVFAQTSKSVHVVVTPAWTTATEGGGVPTGQDASEYEAEVDREVAHGGHASMSMRSIVAKPATFRAVSQFVKADAYRGKRVRLAGYLKTRDVAEWCGHWLRVDGPAGMLAFDNMQSAAVKGTNDWTRHETVLDVPEAASRLAFGPVLKGAGQVWADDLTLEVVDPKDVKATKRQAVPNYAERASNLDFETTGGEAANPLPGWNVSPQGPGSYSHRIAEGGAHAGRSSLEIRSTPHGKPALFFAHQDIVAVPYRGKRVRFRAYLKAEGVADEAFVSLESFSDQSANIFVSRRGQGSKGATDWQPQEVVLDVPADASGLCLSFSLRGRGNLRVDDASLEVVDPSKVPLTADSDAVRVGKEQRSRELANATLKLPDRPENLDFER